jgi:hypothetical protein
VAKSTNGQRIGTGKTNAEEIQRFIQENYNPEQDGPPDRGRWPFNNGKAERVAFAEQKRLWREYQEEAGEEIEGGGRNKVIEKHATSRFSVGRILATGQRYARDVSSGRFIRTGARAVQNAFKRIFGRGNTGD